MIHCPNLTNDNDARLLVTGRLLSASSSSGCRACSECSNPQAVNLVTIGMAIVNKRRRRNQNVDELKTLLKSYLPNQEEPTTLRMAALQARSGNELRKMLAWFARPSDTCKCETRAETMNDWGVEGCRTNLDTIIEWLLEEAQLRGLPHGKFTRTSPSHSCSLPSAGLNVSSQTVHPSPTKTIQIPTKKIVERCFLMNLDRRDDRLHEWMQQLPQPCAIPDVERFAAIDGRKACDAPEQWRAGNGAWGCYRSHLLILEEMFARRHRFVRGLRR